eukprot:Tbor_TRINITY_DN5546_c3_g1::TRINITY_DN5546_c3_g1_i1::g.12755::m.12755
MAPPRKVDTATNEEVKKKKKTKRSDRKGFKQDRYEAYQQKFHKSQYKKDIAPNKNKPSPKEIVFDPVARKDYLLSLHKKKNERRVAAYMDAKRKIQTERKKFRAEQREEGRKAYNSFAQVPILPNYKLAKPKLTDEDEEDEEDSDNNEDEDDDETLKKKKKKSIVPKKGASVYFSNNNNNNSIDNDDDNNNNSGTKAPSSVLDESGISVIITPLGAANTTTTTTNISTHKPTAKELAKSGGTKYNFDNLPVAVAKELAKLREETKGSPVTKPKVSTLKCLEKIRKIQKYSRKGHGKKSKSGKRKNR